MDTSVKKIRPSDLELSQVQDNLTDVIQQLLNWANSGESTTATYTPSMEQVRGPGTPMSVKTAGLVVKGRPDGSYVFMQPTVQFGSPSWQPNAGPLVPQMDAEVVSYGQVVFIGSATQNDGFIIIPQVGGASLRLTNVGNTQTVFQVDSAGNVNAAGALAVAGKTTLAGDTTINAATMINSSLTVMATVVAAGMSSGQGFKATICAGSLYNTALGANALTQLGNTMQNQAVLGGTAMLPFAMRWTHTGSIVGMTLFQNGSVAGVNSLVIYKNAAPVYTWAAGSGAAGAVYWTQFAKATAGLTFLAGDLMTVSYRNSAAGNVQVMAHLTLEMAA